MLYIFSFMLINVYLELLVTLKGQNPINISFKMKIFRFQ